MESRPETILAAARRSHYNPARALQGKIMTDLYLASGSPRRRELLAQIGVSFEKISAPVDETPQPDELAHDYVLRLARAKAEAGWQRMQELGLPPLPVLGADTTVALADHLLGKPERPLQRTVQRRLAQQWRRLQQKEPLELMARLKPVIHSAQRFLHHHAVLAVDEAHLLNISVAEKRQGMGFGARLLDRKSVV